MERSLGKMFAYKLFNWRDQAGGSIEQIVANFLALGEAVATKWIETRKGLILLQMVPNDSASGTEDLWKRLREVVDHMVDRLNEQESRYHGSLVTNVLDLVDILPRLNVGGDADLNRIAGQIKERLCNYSAQELKKHDLVRVTTATDAANIVAEMDNVLRSREDDPAPAPTADYIIVLMSAYMETPAAA